MTKSDVITWSAIARNISIPLLVGILSYGVTKFDKFEDKINSVVIDVAVIKQQLRDSPNYGTLKKD